MRTTRGRSHRDRCTRELRAPGPTVKRPAARRAVAEAAERRARRNPPVDGAARRSARRGRAAEDRSDASWRAAGRVARLRASRADRADARRPLPTRYVRRRRIAALAVAVSLLVAVGLGTRVLLYDAGFADVEEVTVTGLSTVPEQAVRDAAAVPLGRPLVAVDTAGVVQRVAAVEGVAAVEVRRAWPHTVEMFVTERVPVALWASPDGLREVDGTGLAYRLAPQPPPALPRFAFAGVGPQDPSTAAALAVLRDLGDPLRASVTTVEAAGVQVTLGLADGRTVRWGDPERSPEKVSVVVALLSRPGTVYDVSSPDLPTVRP